MKKSHCSTKPKLTPAENCKIYPPLDEEVRKGVSTAACSFYTNRAEQTLRVWACKGGPLTPLKTGSRLTWPVSAIKQFLAGEAS